MCTNVGSITVERSFAANSRELRPRSSTIRRLFFSRTCEHLGTLAEFLQIRAEFANFD